MELEFTRSELTDDPHERNLNLNKKVVVFKIQLSDKTINLNTGQKFTYLNDSYEILNRESVESIQNYVRFNCIKEEKLK